MISKKKISIGSEITQAQRVKKFVRKNSHCSLSCRSASQKKLTLQKKQKEVTISIPYEQTIKMQTESQKFYKKTQQELLSYKRCSESLKLSINQVKQLMKQQESFRKYRRQQSQKDADSLKIKIKKLNIYLVQERSKRKIIEEQMRLGHIQIKRLQRRLQKYKFQNQLLKKTNQQMLLHVQQLQNKNLDSEIKMINSYKVIILEEQIIKIRHELQKDRTTRQDELLKQIDQFAEQNYNLSKQINSNILANSALIKQIQQIADELEQLRLTSHQKVIRSIQYIELRERYKLLLIQHRQLKQQLRNLQNLNRVNNQSRINYTLLTVSNDSEVIQ